MLWSVKDFFFFMTEHYASDENVGEKLHADIIETLQNQKPWKAENQRVVMLWLCTVS
jgi:hypothetical protein